MEDHHHDHHQDQPAETTPAKGRCTCDPSSPGPCNRPCDPPPGHVGHEEHGHEEQDHDHSHGHGHSHVDRKADRTRLLATLGLTASMMVFEAVGGWWSGSLALLSDAGHMLTDAAALLLAVLALWFASRPADLKRTYGFFRLEVLSALVNGLTLVGIAGFIGWEAWQRLANPQPIKAGVMLVVAVVGLLVNLAGMALLSHSKNLNVRAAFLHVLGDALSSVGVIAAAGVTWLTGATWLDPVISIAIGLLIAAGAVGLIRQAVHVLLEAVPEHIELQQVFGALKEIPGVHAVHDLHVWSLSHGLHALSAHVVCDDDADRDRVLVAARDLLRSRFGIGHSTLQLESEALAHQEHEA